MFTDKKELLTNFTKYAVGKPFITNRHLNKSKTLFEDLELDVDTILNQHLVTNGKYLPYNKDLKDRARAMRKNPTIAESTFGITY